MGFMRSMAHPSSSVHRRPLAVALALLWMIAGVAPALHHHEEVAGAVDSHCHDSGLTTSTHLETLELALHETCGLCAKVLSFGGLDWPTETDADSPVEERGREGSRLLPPDPVGRDGASRAPPTV